jgi:dCMP deaminase
MRDMTESWKVLLGAAYHQAQTSTNPSTQNGAILVDDTYKVLIGAANTFPLNIKETPERLLKPARYTYSVHAERNVLFLAAKAGLKTQGLTMVCPWAACLECAQAIIQCGIKTLVTHQAALDRSDHWQAEIDLAFVMLREASVELIVYKGKVGAGKILRQGRVWET